MSKPKEDNNLTEETLGKVSGGANGSSFNLAGLFDSFKKIIGDNSKENHTPPPTNLNK